jgi:hypothetical protein
MMTEKDMNFGLWQSETVFWIERKWIVLTSYEHEMKVQGEVGACVETLENQGHSEERTLIIDCLSVKD